MSDDHEGQEFIFGRWFWISAGILAVGIVALTFLWYARHPEESPFSTFAKGRGPLGSPETNGHIPAHSAPVGSDVVGGEETG